MPGMSKREVKFFFDVSCPFCWITSRWIKEAEQVRDLAIDWVPMSLSVLNEGRDYLPADYQAKMEANWNPARMFARVKQENPDKVDALYTALGTKLHNEGQGGKQGYGAYDELATAALIEVGLLPAGATVADAASYFSSDNDEALRAFHAQAMAKVGDEVGTPVVQLGDTAFFGPVLTRIPRGEEAGEIFDAAFKLAGYPHFFEIKRSRTENPEFA